MPALDVKVKRFIVRALACWDTPSQVAASVKEEFGIEVTRQQVATYDPTKVNGRELSKELTALFNETRAKFKSEIDEIPIANQAFRLRSLARMHQVAETRGNADLAARLLEQAAKEQGGAYTDRRRHQMLDKDGDPTDPPKPAVIVALPPQMSQDEWAQTFSKRPG